MNTHLSQRQHNLIFMLAWVIAAMSTVALAGCATSPAGPRSPYADNGELIRNPELARELHAQATRAIENGDTERAERLLREALAADLYHGPAHNNLGVMHLDRGKLYAAANEFEWARKLMPGHPDPRVNLAMTLEQAGRTGDAIDAYNAALAVWDNYLPALKGKTRLQIITSKTDETTRPALEQIALRGDERWQRWAQEQLILSKYSD